MNVATKQKRTDLSGFIQQEVIAETSVQGLVVIGSVAKGVARFDSDIDAVVFLEPVTCSPSQVSVSGSQMKAYFMAFLAM